MDTSDRVPSYEESVGIASEMKSWKSPSLGGKPSSSISENSARIREEKIDLLIQAHILPRLQDQAAKGIGRRLFYFMPSDWQDASMEEVAASLYERRLGANFILVQLVADYHEAEFWHQPVVVDRLRTALQQALVRDGNRIAIPEEVPSETETSSSKRGPRRLSFKKVLFGEELRSPPMRLGWRNTDEDRKPPRTGEVRVEVRYEALEYKHTTQLGIITTSRVEAIVVDFEIGT